MMANAFELLAFLCVSAGLRKHTSDGVMTTQPSPLQQPCALSEPVSTLTPLIAPPALEATPALCPRKAVADRTRARTAEQQ